LAMEHGHESRHGGAAASALPASSTVNIGRWDIRFGLFPSLAEYPSRSPDRSFVRNMDARFASAAVEPIRGTVATAGQWISAPVGGDRTGRTPSPLHFSPIRTAPDSPGRLRSACLGRQAGPSG